MTVTRPVVFSWRVTSRCHHGCAFCGNASRAELCDSIGKHAAVDYLDQVRRSRGIREVWFSGGEPFLAMWFPDVLAAAFTSNLRVGITTTGTVMKPSTVELLHEHRDQVAHLNVSVHGHTPELYREIHGRDHFAIATRNLSRLRAAAVPFNINLVIEDRNFDAVEDICMFLTDAGARVINLLPVRQVGAAVVNRVRGPSFEDLLSLFAALDERVAQGKCAPVAYVTQDIVARALKPLFPRIIIQVDSCSAHSIMHMEADGRLSLCTQVRDLGLDTTTVNRFLTPPVEPAGLSEVWDGEVFDDFRRNMRLATRRETCLACPSLKAGRCTPCSFRAPGCDKKVELIDLFRSNQASRRSLGPPGRS